MERTSEVVLSQLLDDKLNPRTRIVLVTTGKAQIYRVQTYDARIDDWSYGTVCWSVFEAVDEARRITKQG